MRPSRQEGCRLEKARAPACFVCACHGAASAAAYRTTTRRRHTRSCLTVFPSPGYARVFAIAWDVSSQSGSRTILHHHQPGASYYSSLAATSSLLFAPTLDDAVHSRRTHRLLQEKKMAVSPSPAIYVCTSHQNRKHTVAVRQHMPHHHWLFPKKQSWQFQERRRLRLRHTKAAGCANGAAWVSLNATTPREGTGGMRCPRSVIVLVHICIVDD